MIHHNKKGVLYIEKIATDKCGRLDGVVFQMPQDDEVN